MAEFRTWMNTVLSIEEAEMLKEFLIENDIEFEASEYYDSIYLDVNVNDYERTAINNFIDENF